MQITCNIGKSTGIFGFFNVTAYLRVVLQQPSPEQRKLGNTVQKVQVSPKCTFKLIRKVLSLSNRHLAVNFENNMCTSTLTSSQRMLLINTIEFPQNMGAKLITGLVKYKESTVAHWYLLYDVKIPGSNLNKG